ncbi:MAG: hypothetical protein NT177_04050 [Chloroflexi bacterium]|nr:hypothetical protein [Chloroflexota bacterium]
MKTNDLPALLLPLLLLGLATSCISREYPVTSTYTETAFRTEYVTETYAENETTVDSITDSYELQPFYSWYSQNIAFNGQTNFWYIAYDIPQSPSYDNLRLKVSIWKQLQYESASIRILDMTKGGQLTTPAPAIYGDTGLGQVKWTWITASTTGTTVTSGGSTGGTSDNASGEATSFTIGGASTTWLDMANIQINQAKFLGGRTNLWSRPENPQVFDLDAGRAQKIGIIICGPQNQWNARLTLQGIFTRDSLSQKSVTGERQVARQVPYEVEKQKTTYETRQVPFWEMFSR